MRDRYRKAGSGRAVDFQEILELFYHRFNQLETHAFCRFYIKAPWQADAIISNRQNDLCRLFLQVKIDCSFVITRKRDFDSKRLTPFSEITPERSRS